MLFQCDDPQVRRAFLKVWDGHFPHDEVTHALYYLDCHFPKEKLLDALAYLVRNQITGKRFVQWLGGQCHGSNLKMHQELLKRVEGERGSRLVIFGKDFRK